MSCDVVIHIRTRMRVGSYTAAVFFFGVNNSTAVSEATLDDNINSFSWFFNTSTRKHLNKDLPIMFFFSDILFPFGEGSVSVPYHTTRCSEEVSFPVPFPFFGQNYTSVYVSLKTPSISD